jgi:hypothetical protein
MDLDLALREKATSEGREVRDRGSYWVGEGTDSETYPIKSWVGSITKSLLGTPTSSLIVNRGEGYFLEGRADMIKWREPWPEPTPMDFAKTPETSSYARQEPDMGTRSSCFQSSLRQALRLLRRS